MFQTNSLLNCLKNSHLYNELFINNQSTIESIPKKYLLDTLHINNPETFYKTLDILRFWMVYQLPYEIYDYILSVTDDTILDLKNFKDFHYHELELLTQGIGNKEVEIMIKNNYSDLLKYVLNNYSQVKQSTTWQQKLRTDFYGQPLITMSMCVTASYYGHLELLIYLYDNFSEHNDPVKVEYVYLSSEERKMFASSNSTYTITPHKPIRELKPKLSRTVVCNSTKHPEMFKYLVDNQMTTAEDNNGSVCMYIAENNDLELLEFAHEKGFYINSSCSIGAARNNNLEIIKYLLENNQEIGLQCLLLFASKGNVDALEFFNTNIYQLPNTPIYDKVGYGYGLEDIDLQLCVCAADHNQLECLKYALSKGCRHMYDTNSDAEISHDEDYYDENENEDASYVAAHRGHINILKYLHENNYEICNDSLVYAVLGNHLECLKYLFEIGCTTQLNLLAFAFMVKFPSLLKSNIDLITYLLERGYKLNSKVYAEALNIRGYTQEKQYLIDICEEHKIEKPVYCNYCDYYMTHSCEENGH